MSAFSKTHPLAALAYFAAVLSVGMFSSNPVIQLITLAGGILFCAMLTNAETKKRDLLFYLPMMVIITVTNPLFSHNGVTPLFFLNGNPVTAEAIAYGAQIAVMTASVMLMCKAFSIIITSEKLVYLFGRITPRLALILSTALRYIPMLRRQAAKISRTQKALGLYATESYADRLKSGIKVMSVLIGWSLETAIETARSMKARGYGLKGHTDYSDFRFKKSDFALLLFCLALWSAVIAGTATGALDFEYYPTISAVPTGTFPIICYAAQACLAFLPFIIETEELIKWNCFRSKI